MCGEVVFVQSGVAHCTGPGPGEMSSSYNIMNDDVIMSWHEKCFNEDILILKIEVD